MALGNLAAKASNPRSGRSQGPRSSHVFGVVVGYSIKNDRGHQSTSTPEEDFMTVALYRDALGLQAGQKEDGELTTLVDIAIIPEKKGSGNYAPLSVLDLRKGRGNAKALAPGDIVAFKDVVPLAGQEGKYKARRGEAAIRGFNPDMHYAYSGALSVRRETYTDYQEGRRHKQNVVGLMTDYAMQVGTPEEMAEKVKEAFEISGSVLGATPQVVIRAIQHDGKDQVVHAVARELFLYADGVDLTPEESFANFASGKDNKDGVGIVGAMAENDPNVIFEVIPQFMVRTGTASLPSSRMQDAKQNGKYDEGMAFRYDDSVQFRILNAKGGFESSYMDADVILNRRPNEDPETKADRPWGRTFRTFVQTQRPYLPKMTQEEIVTPNIPPALAETLVKRGEERAREAAQARKAAETPEQPAQDDAAPTPGMG